MDVLRTKSIEQSLQDTEDPEFKLKRRLTALDLTVFGVGVIIGAGIFTLTGRVAQANAGPGVALSFVLAAVCCGLAALCYAEFASTVPVSGSAYTFSYATMGELVAWIIGWDLLLEMMLGASVVAQGWASYFETFLDQIGVAWPDGLGYDDDFNLAAFLLVLILTALVAYGIKESLRVNLVLVAVKLFIVLFVIIAGIGFINADNYDPFIPPSVPVEGGGEWLHTPLLQLMTGSPAAYGVGGVLFAASLVFFAYIGFDVVATTAEEAAHPQKDLPRGIIGSLVICTILYVAVALVITGMVKYDDINPDAALAQAFIDQGKDGYATLISAGAVAGLTTVVMTLLIGAVRVTFAMSRDSLLPHNFGHVSPKTGTPDPDHPRHRRGGRLRRLADARRQAGGDGQHRHADGVLPGVDRDPDPAQEPSRPGAVVQGPAVAVPALAVRRDLPVPDDQPDHRDLAAVPGLDGARLRDLLRLRLPAQPRRQGRGRAGATTTRAEPPACGCCSRSSGERVTSTRCCRSPARWRRPGTTSPIAGSGNLMPRVEAGASRRCRPARSGRRSPPAAT